MQTKPFAEIPLLEFGNNLLMSGVIYSDGTRAFVLPLPEEEKVLALDLQAVEITQEEWKTLLRQTDIMETEILANAKDEPAVKAIVRKSARQIEQNVYWACYRRDNYMCRYCGRNDVPLTVDHLIAWESGGPSIEANLFACCRKCNKIKGKIPYAQWIKHPYYLDVSRRLSEETRKANEEVLATLAAIPLVVHIKSR